MSAPVPSENGFFASLFDFSFTSFITLRFLKVIYGVLVVLILLGAVVFFFVLASQGAGPAILGLFLAPLGALLYLIIARVYLEVVAMFFRIGDNTTRILQAVGGTPGESTYGSQASYGGPQPSPYGQPPAMYGQPTGYGQNPPPGQSQPPSSPSQPSAVQPPAAQPPTDPRPDSGWGPPPQQ